MPRFSIFFSSNTAPPRPKSPAGGLAWSQLTLTTRTTTQCWTSKILKTPPPKNRSMCVYACASEPVPNESFTGSSTSGHSSSQEETVSMCLCVCITVYLHTQIHSSGRFPAGVSRHKNDQLLTLSKKKKKNQCLSVYNTPNFFRYFYTTAAYMYATWTTALHHSRPQLSVSVSYQKPNFPDTPCSPFVSGIVTLPRFESLSLGDE